MKRISAFLLAGCLVVALSDDTSAHVGATVYPIFELSTADLPDLQDGSLEDWEDVLGEPSLTHDDFGPRAVGDGAGIDPADLAYRIFLGWNSADQRIYMGLERIDNIYLNWYAGGAPQTANGS